MIKIPKKGKGVKYTSNDTIDDANIEKILQETKDVYQHMMHRKLLPDYSLTEDERDSYRKMAKEASYAYLHEHLLKIALMLRLLTGKFDMERTEKMDQAIELEKNACVIILVNDLKKIDVHETYTFIRKSVQHASFERNHARPKGKANKLLDFMKLEEMFQHKQPPNQFKFMHDKTYEELKKSDKFPTLHPNKQRFFLRCCIMSRLFYEGNKIEDIESWEQCWHYNVRNQEKLVTQITADFSRVVIMKIIPIRKQFDKQIVASISMEEVTNGSNTIAAHAFFLNHNRPTEQNGPTLHSVHMCIGDAAKRAQCFFASEFDYDAVQRPASYYLSMALSDLEFDDEDHEGSGSQLDHVCEKILNCVVTSRFSNILGDLHLDGECFLQFPKQTAEQIGFFEYEATCIESYVNFWTKIPSMENMKNWARDINRNFQVPEEFPDMYRFCKCIEWSDKHSERKIQNTDFFLAQFQHISPAVLQEHEGKHGMIIQKLKETINNKKQELSKNEVLDFFRDACFYLETKDKDTVTYLTKWFEKRKKKGGEKKECWFDTKVWIDFVLNEVRIHVSQQRQIGFHIDYPFDNSKPEKTQCPLSFFAAEPTDFIDLILIPREKLEEIFQQEKQNLLEKPYYEYSEVYKIVEENDPSQLDTLKDTLYSIECDLDECHYLKKEKIISCIRKLIKDNTSNEKAREWMQIELGYKKAIVDSCAKINYMYQILQLKSSSLDAFYNFSHERVAPTSSITNTVKQETECTDVIPGKPFLLQIGDRKKMVIKNPTKDNEYVIFDRNNVELSQDLKEQKIFTLKTENDQKESITSGIDYEYSSEVSLGPLIMFEQFARFTSHNQCKSFFESIILSLTSEKFEEIVQDPKWMVISSEVEDKQGTIACTVTLHRHNYERVRVTCIGEKFSSNHTAKPIEKNQWHVDNGTRKKAQLKVYDTLIIFVPKWKSMIGLFATCICINYDSKSRTGFLQFKNGEKKKCTLGESNDQNFLPPLDILGFVVEHWAIIEKPQQNDVVGDRVDDKIETYVAHRRKSDADMTLWSVKDLNKKSKRVRTNHMYTHNFKAKWTFEYFFYNYEWILRPEADSLSKLNRLLNGRKMNVYDLIKSSIIKFVKSKPVENPLSTQIISKYAWTVKDYNLLDSNHNLANINFDTIETMQTKFISPMFLIKEFIDLVKRMSKQIEGLGFKLNEEVQKLKDQHEQSQSPMLVSSANSFINWLDRFVQQEKKIFATKNEFHAYDQIPFYLDFLEPTLYEKDVKPARWKFVREEFYEIHRTGQMYWIDKNKRSGNSEATYIEMNVIWPDGVQFSKNHKNILIINKEDTQLQIQEGNQRIEISKPKMFGDKFCIDQCFYNYADVGKVFRCVRLPTFRKAICCWIFQSAKISDSLSFTQICEVLSQCLHKTYQELILYDLIPTEWIQRTQQEKKFAWQDVLQALEEAYCAHDFDLTTEICEMTQTASYEYDIYGEMIRTVFELKNQVDIKKFNKDMKAGKQNIDAALQNLNKTIFEQVYDVVTEFEDAVLETILAIRDFDTGTLWKDVLPYIIGPIGSLFSKGTFDDKKLCIKRDQYSFLEKVPFKVKRFVETKFGQIEHAFESCAVFKAQRSLRVIPGMERFDTDWKIVDFFINCEDWVEKFPMRYYVHEIESGDYLSNGKQFVKSSKRSWNHFGPRPDQMTSDHTNEVKEQFCGRLKSLQFEAKTATFVQKTDEKERQFDKSMGALKTYGDTRPVEKRIDLDKCICSHTNLEQQDIERLMRQSVKIEQRLFDDNSENTSKTGPKITYNVLQRVVRMITQKHIDDNGRKKGMPITMYGQNKILIDIDEEQIMEDVKDLSLMIELDSMKQSEDVVSEVAAQKVQTQTQNIPNEFETINYTKDLLTFMISYVFGLITYDEFTQQLKDHVKKSKFEIELQDDDSSKQLKGHVKKGKDRIQLLDDDEEDEISSNDDGDGNDFEELFITPFSTFFANRNSHDLLWRRQPNDNSTFRITQNGRTRSGTVKRTVTFKNVEYVIVRMDDNVLKAMEKYKYESETQSEIENFARNYIDEEKDLFNELEDVSPKQAQYPDFDYGDDPTNEKGEKKIENLVTTEVDEIVGHDLVNVHQEKSWMFLVKWNDNKKSTWVSLEEGEKLQNFNDAIHDYLYVFHDGDMNAEPRIIKHKFETEKQSQTCVFLVEWKNGTRNILKWIPLKKVKKFDAFDQYMKQNKDVEEHMKEHEEDSEHQIDRIVNHKCTNKKKLSTYEFEVQFSDGTKQWKDFAGVNELEAFQEYIDKNQGEEGFPTLDFFPEPQFGGLTPSESNQQLSFLEMWKSTH